MTESALEGIRAFLPLSDRIGTAGQPTEAQFVAIRDAGYQMVVNLALPISTGALSDEAATVSSLGMQYISVPVEWEAPTQDDLHKFFDVMDAAQDKKLFVHCAANMRVSAFMYLYRTLRQGVPAEEARTDMNRIWTPDGHWQRFIETATENSGRAAG